MSKKIVLVFVIVFFLWFLFGFHLAKADVIINEVFCPLTSGSLPGSKQWIEIYNDTDTDINNITQYKILDYGAHSDTGGHGISAITGGSTTIPAHDYGIIAKDPTSVNATHLFKASLGIKNAAEWDKIILRSPTGDNVVQLSQLPDCANTNTDSFQKFDSTWESAVPTPGSINRQSSTSSSGTPTGNGALLDNNSSLNNNSAPSTSTETKSKAPEEQKIKTQIVSKTVGFAGMPVALEAKTYGRSGEQLHFGKYFWNFGDGDSKEISLNDNAGPFNHTYFYPGDYAVTLDYYSTAYQDTPDASAQMAIKIIPENIIISKVGDEKDFFVELANNTDYPADISSWFLQSDQNAFVLPRNTILASKNKMMLSPRVTKFSVGDKDTLRLMTPEREVAFAYGVSNSPLEEYPEALPRGEVDNASTPSRQRATPQEGNNLVENPETKIPANNLTSAVVSSDVSEPAPKSSSRLPVIVISALFIGVAAYAVYFIRQKKVLPKAGNDFEILDE